MTPEALYRFSLAFMKASNLRSQDRYLMAREVRITGLGTAPETRPAMYETRKPHFIMWLTRELVLQPRLQDEAHISGFLSAVHNDYPWPLS